MLRMMLLHLGASAAAQAWHDISIMQSIVLIIENITSLVTATVSLGIEILAVIIVAYAATQAFGGYFHVLVTRAGTGTTERIRLRLGYSLILGLEFLIGADILRTAIAPTWSRIGQLAAIIMLRSLLEYLLEGELRGLAKRENRESENPDTQNK